MRPRILRRATHSLDDNANTVEVLGEVVDLAAVDVAGDLKSPAAAACCRE